VSGGTRLGTVAGIDGDELDADELGEGDFELFDDGISEL
jgi:hypothetical protein